MEIKVNELIKKTTCGAAVAIAVVSFGIPSLTYGWGNINTTFRNDRTYNNNHQKSSGRDTNSNSRNYTHSANRYNSHNISGTANNNVFGNATNTIGHGAGSDNGKWWRGDSGTTTISSGSIYGNKNTIDMSASGSMMIGDQRQQGTITTTTNNNQHNNQ